MFIQNTPPPEYPGALNLVAYEKQDAVHRHFFYQLVSIKHKMNRRYSACGEDHLHSAERIVFPHLPKQPSVTFKNQPFVYGKIVNG